VGFVWSASPRQPGETGGARTVATLLAVGAAVLLAAAGTSQGPTYALSVDAFDEPLGPLNRFDVHQSYGNLLAAYVFAGAAVAVTCRAARAWPRAIVWSGYAAAALSLAAILFLPLIALPLWAAATGLWLAVHNRGGP
jgi:hypothetical protein